MSGHEAWPKLFIFFRAGEPEPAGAGRSRLKKRTGAEPEPLGKKSGAGAAKKLAGKILLLFFFLR